MLPTICYTIGGQSNNPDQMASLVAYSQPLFVIICLFRPNNLLKGE